MPKLFVSNKVFEVNVNSITDEEIKLKLKTFDSSFFKHDLDVISKNDKMLVDAYLRNYSYTLRIDDKSYDLFYPTKIRKSKEPGYRILTFNKFNLK